MSQFNSSRMEAATWLLKQFIVFAIVAMQPAWVVFGQQPNPSQILLINPPSPAPAKSAAQASQVLDEARREFAAAGGQPSDDVLKKICAALCEKEEMAVVPGAISTATGIYTMKNEGALRVLIPAGDSLERQRQSGLFRIETNAYWNDQSPVFVAGAPVAPQSLQASPGFSFGGRSLGASPSTTSGSPSPTAGPTLSSAAGPTLNSSPSPNPAPAPPTPQVVPPAQLQAEADLERTKLELQSAQSTLQNTITAFQSTLSALQSTTQQSQGVQADSPTIQQGGSTGCQVPSALVNGFAQDWIKLNGDLNTPFVWTQKTAPWKIFYLISPPDNNTLGQIEVFAVIHNRTAYDWKGSTVTLRTEGQALGYELKVDQLPPTAVGVFRVAKILNAPNAPIETSKVQLGFSANGRLYYNRQLPFARNMVVVQNDGNPFSIPIDGAAPAFVKRDHSRIPLQSLQVVTWDSNDKNQYLLLDEERNVAVKAQESLKKHFHSIDFQVVATRTRKETKYTLENRLPTKVNVLVHHNFASGETAVPKDRGVCESRELVIAETWKPTFTAFRNEETRFDLFLDYTKTLDQIDFKTTADGKSAPPSEPLLRFVRLRKEIDEIAVDAEATKNQIIQIEKLRSRNLAEQATEASNRLLQQLDVRLAGLLAKRETQERHSAQKLEELDQALLDATAPVQVVEAPISTAATDPHGLSN